MTSKAALTGQVRAFDVEGVRRSLDHRPDLLDLRDDRGRTWLHLCCSCPVTRTDRAPSIKLAAELLARGLDKNDAAFTEGTWRATPVWFSVARGRNLDLTRFLLERGATPEHSLWAAAYNDDIPAISLLLQHGAEIDAVAEEETPFLWATKTSHFGSAWELARQGADVNATDSAGMTALHYMLKKRSEAPHFTAFAEFGPSVDIPDPTGRTAREILIGRRTQPCKPSPSG
jgi:ankyrin repeat protein